MPKREKITLIIWLFLSLFICVESVRLGLGTLRAPGPGFLTFGVSVFIILCVCSLFLKKTGRKFAGDVVSLFKGKNIRDVIYTVIGLLGYALLLERLGFLLCTLCFVGFSLKMIKPQSWRMVLVMSIGVAIFCHFLFNVWLTLQLPEGTWLNQLLSFIKGSHLWK